MNERIRELAEQAAEVVFSSPSTGRTTKQINLEKFAELVWKEAYESGYDAGCSDTFEGGV